MDPKFVNLLIQQLLNTTICPKCGASLSPLNVKVENVGPDNCIFKMQCSVCQSVIAADAQINKVLKKTQQNPATPKTMEQKPVQKIQEIKHAQTPAVSPDDILAMQKQLQNFPGSFKSLFQ